jgi:hypothetical protein
MSLEDRGLTQDILSKLVIEYDESKQSSILGTVKLSKRNLLVIQSKIWDNKPYFDFRIWGKNEEGYYVPTPKGLMISLVYKESGKEEKYPLQDFVRVFQGILAMPNEKEANSMSNETADLTTKMLQGIIDRGAKLTQPQIDKTSKRKINSFIFSPIDEQFISP